MAELPAALPPEQDLDRPGLYLNRELSWLRFNERVLEEALDPENPLLERVSFLTIFFGNLDEFFMVRVSGLLQQRKAGVIEPPPDGMTPAEQLQAIREQLLPLLERADACWSDDLQPALTRAGVRVASYGELSSAQQAALRLRFENEIFPVLTPLAFDPGHPFPHISSRSMNLAVVVTDPETGEKFARLKVPANFPRLLLVPEASEPSSTPSPVTAEVASNRATLVWIEEVIAANLDRLFPGVEIVDSFPFRVTRNADLEIEEDEAADLLTAMAEVVGRRHFGSAIRLEIDGAMPGRIREILVENLELEAHQVYTTTGPIGFTDLGDLRRLERPELRYPTFLPALPPPLSESRALLETLHRRDVVLYHPYDSFAPVVSFLRQAASDPDVLAIKQTLYRVGPNSPIVEALMAARENGKQVSALVELKARFDEESNIEWARALEEAGVHVVYGLLGLKTHAKMCLVVRRERDGVRRYVHLATGNYNGVTARAYGDLGFFTCDPDLAEDVSDLFNALTGYSRKRQYRKLLVAPVNMREEILRRIDREIEAHRSSGGGHLAFKVNSLVDKACIQSLYRAAQAGVRVDLQVRGICCLRPEVPGLSERITVTSVVGRFLEHARILYFANGGRPELYAGSADLMPRNLDGRVEALFPIESPDLLAAIRDQVLFLHLSDNVKSRRLQADGTYVEVEPGPGEPRIDSQHELLVRQNPWRVAD
ncbi:MAG TPA: polyphosphate kinase 1 [Thermoanaerobaculia bacterium]|nr:polyphosphate kinase 1 [Thermoanaerobaculia bacterium]